MTEPRLVVLNVGQGDAIIAHNPATSRVVVVDCALAGAAQAVQYLHEHDLFQIDTVFVTHLDADHFAGLPELLRHVPSRRVGYGIAKGYRDAHAGVDSFLRSMLQHRRKTGATYFRPLDGVVIDEPGIRFRVFGPTVEEETDATSRNNANFASTLMRGEIGDLSVLLAGDCPPWRWARTVQEYGATLRSDVFMVPHHGAAHSPQPHGLLDILDLVSPKVLVVSVGSRNRYWHPRESTLSIAGRWALDHDCRLVCTQLNEYCRINVKAKGPANSACAGTILLEREATSDAVSVMTWRPDHPAFVATLAAPRCVPVPGP